MTQSELLALSCTGVSGDTEKAQCNMAYLLIAQGKTIQGEMAFRLAMVWAHPHEAYLPSLDEVVRKLTLLIDIGDNWVYTFVQLNEGTLHVPLSSKGDISAMINGALSRTTCGHLHQLQVQKLLQCRSHVVWPEGLKLPVWDTNTLSRPVHESLPLQVDLPWVMLGDKMSHPRSPQSLDTAFLPMFSCRVS